MLPRRGMKLGLSQHFVTETKPRFACPYAVDSAVADEVVQETWLRVLRSIDRFESRSSLKTWIYRILVNTAIGSATRERRSIPFSRFDVVNDGTEPAVEPEHRARSSAAGQRSARLHPRRHRSAADRTADGRHDARCRRLDVRRRM